MFKWVSYDIVSQMHEARNGWVDVYVTYTIWIEVTKGVQLLAVLVHVQCSKS